MEANTVTELLIDEVRSASGFEIVEPQMTFAELGLDSLDFICMINEVREKVGPIDDKTASQLYTVGDLLAHFSA